MKLLYFLKKCYILLLLVVVSSCGKDDAYEQVSPVVIDLSAVPYPRLSDYKFFDNEQLVHFGFTKAKPFIEN